MRFSKRKKNVDLKLDRRLYPLIDPNQENTKPSSKQKFPFIIFCLGPYGYSSLIS